MKYRMMDANGDYRFGKNSQDFYIGSEAVAQAILTNLKLLQAEWWEDVEAGLPLFQNILGQSGSKTNLDSVDLIIRDRILATQGVKAIEEFSSSYEKRSYRFSCRVSTIYNGQARVEVIF
ncbi:hypothetical protein HMPREF0322_00391 [Desulfitobacterium hafniense DP7]|uniref:Bacteriophage protein n=1 Tax=Desulfitobacterium hafniense DP7 TaxID=537010 RepID=G9XHG6_DESHA|nr:hypothetical protein [Desulfitobacterium hafniense]EHL08968.1 hypothetical protein HMPREF0322_00391 [Desulfitobacterium hafniense DP7]